MGLHPPCTADAPPREAKGAMRDVLLVTLHTLLVQGTEVNMPSTWIQDLMGFREESPEQVRSLISVDGNTLLSKANGKRYVYGELEILSLRELRQRVDSFCPETKRKSTVREVVANVQDLHVNAANTNAMFQVASQFNMLEMISPQMKPEDGLSIYQQDLTQGPACAIAAGAGTIYRNYLVPLMDCNGTAIVGQTRTCQIDGLADLGKELGNEHNRLWKMKNGYCLAKTTGLEEITRRLNAATSAERFHLQSLLRVGIMWDTQVTLGGAQHVVSQVYCSALPVAYSIQSPAQWQAFARLILEAAYEATICAAILNYQKTGNNKVYLTTLGGGAFGNKLEWILCAMRRSIEIYREYGLDIEIVSYESSDRHVEQLLEELNENVSSDTSTLQ
jgi:hypothetical protein